MDNIKDPSTNKTVQLLKFNDPLVDLARRMHPAVNRIDHGILIEHYSESTGKN